MASVLPNSGPSSPACPSSSRLNAARQAALKLASSILESSNTSSRLYYDDGIDENPTLDPIPIMFISPREEKLISEKKQFELSQKNILIKKSWLKISELKNEQSELERVLLALKSNPSIKVGNHLENNINSMIRLKNSRINLEISKVKYFESELQHCKIEEHEEKVLVLYAKIACVERLKREQSKRLCEETCLKTDSTCTKVNEIESSNVIQTKRERQMFFCDCFQGLSTWYCKCLYQRGWLPYPHEEWFTTKASSKSGLLIYCPLSKSSVDYCDTTSFSKTCHSLLWEGGDWLEDKAKLALLMRHTDFMPQTLIIPNSEGASLGWDGRVSRDMLCCVPEKDINKWLDIEKSGMRKFFVKVFLVFHALCDAF